MENPNPKRILIIKLRAIGDVIMATPFIENIRRHFPDSRITFLTEPASEDIIKSNPYLDDIIILNKKYWNQQPIWQSLKLQMEFYKKLRGNKFDMVFDLFGNPRSALLALISGAPERIGFGFRFRKYCYTRVIKPRGGELHEVDFNLDALTAMDIPVISRRLHLEISNAASQSADAWMAENRPAGKHIVGINPGGGWDIKRWPPEKFGKLADELISRFGVGVILLWGPGEESILEAVKTAMESPPTTIPETTLEELGAFISHCRLIVSNDSGPMHMAVALDIPTVGIFGPTNPHLQGPFGEIHKVARDERVECLGCNRLTCDIGNICMTKLSVDEVIKHVEAILT